MDVRFMLLEVCWSRSYKVVRFFSVEKNQDAAGSLMGFSYGCEGVLFIDVCYFLFTFNLRK